MAQLHLVSHSCYDLTERSEVSLLYIPEPHQRSHFNVTPREVMTGRARCGTARGQRGLRPPSPRRACGLVPGRRPRPPDGPTPTPCAGPGARTPFAPYPPPNTPPRRPTGIARVRRRRREQGGGAGKGRGPGRSREARCPSPRGIRKSRGIPTPTPWKKVPGFRRRGQASEEEPGHVSPLDRIRGRRRRARGHYDLGPNSKDSGPEGVPPAALIMLQQLDGTPRGRSGPGLGVGTWVGTSRASACCPRARPPFMHPRLVSGHENGDPRQS